MNTEALKAMKKEFIYILALVICFSCSYPIPQAVDAAATLELYGTFHSMGVIVSLGAADDPDGDASAALEYQADGEAYRAGFPLTRVDATRFAGSLFWLEPGTSYNVRVTFSDPDGGALDGVALTGSGSTRAEINVPPAQHSYFASPDGSGTTCSLALPCALSEGISRAQAGDEVVLRGGVYYQGEIDLPRSGAPGAPIVLRGYANETAVLDGADPAAFTWGALGGGVYQTTVYVAGTHLVTAGGERLYPYQNLADLQTLSWGIPGFFADGQSLYVHLAGGADPAGVPMVVSRFNYAFLVEQDFIYFSNLTFRHYGQGSYAKALYFNNASDNLVQNSTFAINDLGIGIKRDSHRNVFQDNLFYDTTFLWPWDAVKEGSALETGGISFYSPATGRGNVMRRNTFHDYFDGFTSCPEDNGSETNETDVYDNLVFNAGDDGLSADGACSNVRLWGNEFHDVLVGISLAPIYEGPIYALRNLIYRTGAGDSSYSGYPFKFNSGYPQSGVMYLFHNTADAVYPGNNGFDIKSPGSWQLIYARNNIWAGTEYALQNANPDQPLDLDYDNLYTSLPGEFAWWDDLPDRHLNTLAEFQAATGLELHGSNLEPDFSDSAHGDYTLPEGSNMVDKGMAIPGINDGFAGGAPDLGAFEQVAQHFLRLAATPADQALHLSWTVGASLPVGATWTIQAASDQGAQPPPVSGLSEPTRAYTLSGLTNYAWYTVTLSAMLDSTPLVSDTAIAMPSDIFLFLPVTFDE